MDNQNVASIIHSGSRNQCLQDGVLAIFIYALRHPTQVEWVPYAANDQADALSRIMDYNDLQLDPASFWQLDLLWGLHTMDRFADNHNAQLACFDSWWRCPYTEAVDTFTWNW